MPPEQDLNNNFSSNVEQVTGSINNNLRDLAADPNKLLTVAIADLKVLHAAYMPFIINGGLFIPTKKPFTMGEIVPLAITMLKAQDQYFLNGKVIWITPETSNLRPAGIGVQFLDPGAKEITLKIQSLLEGKFDPKENTNTM